MNKEQIEDMIEGLVRRKKILSESIEIAQKLDCYESGIIRLRKYKIIN